MNAISKKPNVLVTMADAYGLAPEDFKRTIMATVMPGNVRDEHFMAFLMVANEYNLNPLTREIYAFPSKGGVQAIVSVDGWCKLMNSHPQFDGLEFNDIREDGKLVAVECRIYRKDRSHSTSATEYLEECKQATQPWTKWPARMLRHKAMIQAARYSFGFAGIIDPDEADRMKDVTPPPPIPKREDFISGNLKTLENNGPPVPKRENFKEPLNVNEFVLPSAGAAAEEVYVYTPPGQIKEQSKPIPYKLEPELQSLDEPMNDSIEDVGREETIIPNAKKYEVTDHQGEVFGSDDLQIAAKTFIDVITSCATVGQLDGTWESNKPLRDLIKAEAQGIYTEIFALAKEKKKELKAAS